MYKRPEGSILEILAFGNHFSLAAVYIFCSTYYLNYEFGEYSTTVFDVKLVVMLQLKFTSISYYAFNPFSFIRMA